MSQPEEVHLNRGVIYSDYLRQDAAAERELQAALTALNPNYIPALLNLANLREDLRQARGGAALYERILAIEPRSSRGARTLRQAADGLEVRDDALIGRLRDVIADPATQPAERASLGFALGKTARLVRRLRRGVQTPMSDANDASRESAGSATPRFTTAGGTNCLSIS